MIVGKILFTTLRNHSLTERFLYRSAIGNISYFTAGRKKIKKRKKGNKKEELGYCQTLRDINSVRINRYVF